MEKIQLSVSGMSCQGCADSLSGLFEKEPGVLSTDVSFEKQSANIEFDPSEVTKPRLTEIISKAGFEAG